MSGEVQGSSAAVARVASGVRLLKYSIYLNVSFLVIPFLIGSLVSVAPSLENALTGIFVFVALVGYIGLQPVAVYRVSAGIGEGVGHRLAAVLFSVVPLVSLAVIVPLRSRGKDALASGRLGRGSPDGGGLFSLPEDMNPYFLFTHFKLWGWLIALALGLHAVDAIQVRRAGELTVLDLAAAAGGLKAQSRYVTIENAVFGAHYIQSTTKSKDDPVPQPDGTVWVLLSPEEPAQEAEGGKPVARVVVKFKKEKDEAALAAEIPQYDAGKLKLTGILAGEGSSLAAEDRRLLSEHYELVKAPLVLLAGESPQDYLPAATAYMLAALSALVVLYGLFRYGLALRFHYRRYLAPRADADEDSVAVPSAKGITSHFLILKLAALDAILPLAPWAIVLKTKVLFMAQTISAPLRLGKHLFQALRQGRLLAALLDLVLDEKAIHLYAVLGLVCYLLERGAALGDQGIFNIQLAAAALSIGFWLFVGRAGFLKSVAVSLGAVFGLKYFVYGYLPKLYQEGFQLGHLEAIHFEGIPVQADLLASPVYAYYLPVSYLIGCYVAWFCIAMGRHREAAD